MSSLVIAVLSVRVHVYVHDDGHVYVYDDGHVHVSCDGESVFGGLELWRLRVVVVGTLFSRASLARRLYPVSDL